MNQEAYIMQVDKNMTIGEIIRLDAELVELLLGYGMHCVGCPSAQGESLEEACFVHGLDPDPLVDQLNEFLANK